MSLPLATRINGQVIDQTWFNQINDELVDINDRLIANTSGDSFLFKGEGDYGSIGLKTGFNGPYIISKAVTITGGTLKFLTAPSAGNLEIDIEFKRGAGAWTSVFDQRPKIPAAAGDLATSDTGSGATAALINTSVEELESGDLIRLNTTEVPGGSDITSAFLMQLRYDVTGAV